MITKKELLKNIRNYTPEEIADAVKNGVVSIYDLNKETEGAFTPLIKRQVKAILDNSVNSSANVEITINNNESQSFNEFSIETTTIDNFTSESTSSVENSVIPEPAFTGPITEHLENTDAPTTVISHKKPAMFSRLFSFKGRIRRLEYGITYLVYSIWNMPMQVLPETQIAESYAIIYLVSLIPFVWILFAQGAKRCHDRGNSGWYQIIPFYGLWMIFAEGEANANEYGESPK